MISLSTPDSGGTILKTLPKQLFIRADLKERKEQGKSREMHIHPGLLIVCKLAGYWYQAHLPVPGRGQSGTERDTEQGQQL